MKILFRLDEDSCSPKKFLVLMAKKETVSLEPPMFDTCGKCKSHSTKDCDFHKKCKSFNVYENEAEYGTLFLGFEEENV